MAIHTLRWFDSVDTPEQRADMAVLSVDWTWLDYLSTGDGVRVMLLLQKLEEGGPDDAMTAAAAMLDRIRKTAESRKATIDAMRAWYAEKAAPPEIQSPITDAAIDAAVAEADPLAGLPEAERLRIIGAATAAGIAARDACMAESQDADAARSAYGPAHHAALVREVAAYRAQKGERKAAS